MPGSFVVTGFPATTAGVAQTFTVTVKDAFDNVCTGYAGTVNFSSSDVQAGLPAADTFTADAGAHTFTATLKTAGSQSITVQDTANAAIVGSQTGIAVTAGRPRSSCSLCRPPLRRASASPAPSRCSAKSNSVQAETNTKTDAVVTRVGRCRGCGRWRRQFGGLFADV
jgi:hypothetical protein